MKWRIEECKNRKKNRIENDERKFLDIKGCKIKFKKNWGSKLIRGRGKKEGEIY